MVGIANTGDGFGLFGLLLIGIPAALLLIAWLLVAGSLTLRESSVEKPQRVTQLYGYTVCLISVILALVSFSGLLDAAFERGNPLQGGDFPYGVSLTSFEAFKARRSVGSPFERGEPVPADTASEPTLRARYDALVAERIDSVRYRTSKALITKGIFLLLSLGLFRFHWRWVRRMNGGSEPPAG